MKLEIHITDFLRTGQFGTVKINDSVEAVIKKLGKPDGEHNPEVVKPGRGLHYSMYEFFFVDNKLESIQNDHFDSRHPESMEFENDVFKLNTAFLKADRVKTMREIESELEKLNIEYKLIDYWGRIVIKTIGGVILDFNDENWSDQTQGSVKIENLKDVELIGLRFHQGQSNK